METSAPRKAARTIAKSVERSKPEVRSYLSLSVSGAQAAHNGSGGSACGRGLESPILQAKFLEQPRVGAFGSEAFRRAQPQQGSPSRQRKEREQDGGA